MSEVEAKTTITNGNGEQGSTVHKTLGELPKAEVLLSGTRELSLRSFREEAEINAISIALKQTGWNRKRAAKLLSVSYRGLLYKMRRHNITPDSAMGGAVPVEGSE